MAAGDPPRKCDAALMFADQRFCKCTNIEHSSLVLAILVTVLCVPAFAQRTAPDSPKKPVTKDIWEDIAWAKKNHVKVVTFPAPIEFRERPESLEQAVKDRTVLVGQVIDSKTVPFPPDFANTLVSWYKIKIVETLTGDPPIAILDQPGLPEALKPLADNEFAVREFGGTFVSDGVTLICKPNGGASLVVGQSYLLFLSVDRHYPLGVAISYGSSGAIAIEGNGDLKPMRPHSDDPITSAIEEGTIKSMADFKKYLHENR